MSFKIGDIVTPKNGYVAEGYMFKIINKYYESYPVCKWKYKLQRITQELKIEGISANTLLNEIKYAEESSWEEDELNFEYRYNKTNDAVDTLAYATQVMGCPINQINIIGDSIQEEIPTPDKPQEIKNKNLFDNKWNIIRTPLKVDNPVYEYYKNLCKKEINDMDILNLYKERKMIKINNDYNTELQKITKEDEIQKIILEMQLQINTILENESRDERVDLESPNKDILTTESKEKINELEVETDKSKDELYATLEEIKALFEMTDDYNERMKILTNYKILNKDGKLNV